MSIPKVAAVSGIIIAGLLLYFMVDPTTSLWMPQCGFHRITGLDCPGCGAQRMFHALLHGDFIGAWGYNPFLMLLIPFIILLFIVEMAPRRFPRLFRRLHSSAMIVTFAILTMGWTIFRNL